MHGERSAQNHTLSPHWKPFHPLHPYQGMTNAPKFVAPHAYPNREVAPVCCRPEAGAGCAPVEENT